MIQALTITNLLDPRGRIDRKGLFWLALALLACQAALALLVVVGGGAAMIMAAAVKAALLWVGIVALVKRLHDVGLSAIWIPIGVFALIVWSNLLAVAMVFTVGLEALQPDSPEFMITFGLCLVPLLAVALWLHLAKGAPAPNQYGVPPGPTGFSGPPALLLMSSASPVGVTASSEA